MRGRTVRTAKKRQQFLKALSNGLWVGAAAASAGLGRTAVYAWRHDDAQFAAEWEDAFERGTDMFENALRGLAAKGDLGAIIFALKARRPDVYNRRMMLAVGGDPDAQPIRLEHSIEQMPRIWIPRTQREEPSIVEYDPEPAIEGDARQAAGKPARMLSIP